MKVTVKEKTENEIDWNVVQLVISKTEKDFIVQISKDQSRAFDDDCFVGQKLDDGDFVINWRKNAFKKFNGTITIEQ
jgi:hypothetical protein